MKLEILQPDDLTQSEFEAYFSFLAGECYYFLEQAV